MHVCIHLTSKTIMTEQDKKLYPHVFLKLYANK